MWEWPIFKKATENITLLHHWCDLMLCHLAGSSFPTLLTYPLTLFFQCVHIDNSVSWWQLSFTVCLSPRSGNVNPLQGSAFWGFAKWHTYYPECSVAGQRHIHLQCTQCPGSWQVRLLTLMILFTVLSIIIPMRLFLIIKGISNGQSAFQCSLNVPYFTINVLCSYAHKLFPFLNMDACLLASPNNAWHMIWFSSWACVSI